MRFLTTYVERKPVTPRVGRSAPCKSGSTDEKVATIRRKLAESRSWISACIAAGLGKEVKGDKGKVLERVAYRIPHAYRRSAARNLSRAGVPERVVMQPARQPRVPKRRRRLRSVAGADDSSPALAVGAETKVPVSPGAGEPIKSGMSGGPFVNESGRLVGVVSWGEQQGVPLARKALPGRIMGRVQKS